MKKTLTLLFTYIFAGIALYAGPDKLINDASQLWSDCGYTGDAPGTGDSQPISVLIDGNGNTHWHSDYKGTVTTEHYLDVIFPGGITFAGDEQLVVMTQRRNATHAQPTAFEITASTDPASAAQGQWYTWDAGFCMHAYFVYRGPLTKEYSSRIPMEQGKTYYRLRFTLKSNNAKSFSAAGVRFMNMAEFQLYRLKTGDNYPDGLRDRFHLTTDGHYDYYDYEFMRTGGILDPEVRRGVDGLDGWIGTPHFDADGKWTADADFFEKYPQLKKPDYTQVTSQNDSRITNPDIKYQPAHVTEHELYVIPGDAVALYPFYDIYYQTAYHEKFTHWYNYQTGGNVEDANGVRVLDFLVDPAGIYISKNNGYFGGQALKYSHKRRRIEINSVADYRAFVTAANNGTYQGDIAVLNTDLDFAGQTDIVPIGTQDMPFMGFFEGNGHTIRNLNISFKSETDRGIGIFGWVSSSVVVQNLIVDSSCSITGYEYVGVIGAYKDMRLNNPTINTANFVNIVNHANITGTGPDSCCGGILGSVRSGGNVTMTFSNCAFTATITGNQANGHISGYVQGNTLVTYKNCFSTGTINGGTWGIRFACLDPTDYRFINCYCVDDYNGGADKTVYKMMADEANTPGFIAKVGGNWQQGGVFPSTRYESAFNDSKGLFTASRTYGTVATFFYPRDVKERQLQHLDKEYYVAVDFAQDMNYGNYFDNESKTIREPLINFRHIFHIKDGKKFADDNFATKEKNDEYISRNRRHITAEAGRYFQIRFDSPVPVEQTTRSRLYYKVLPDESDYRRVCSMSLRVKDKDGNIIKDINDGIGDQKSFYASETFKGYGSRVIDDITYNACGGGGSYYRMLACNADRTLEGTYTVQLIGRDYNGNVIIIPDGSGAELLIQEMVITFLPKTAAVLVGEETLKNPEYKKATNAWLETNYGAPRDKIDYDEYMAFNELDEATRGRYLYMDPTNGGTARSKWPVAWNQSNYSFAYGVDHDYNMYQVVSHSRHVVYHAQADYKMTPDKNYGTGTSGAFDRLFYETEGARRGFYYWVNAAADPGVMGYLTLDDFCPGSTIHVSGWLNEFSGSERANLTLNFVAVYDDNGERIPLHSHTTGYVDQATMGMWQYFYASFVPILTDKDFDTSRSHHYEIELDNNCKNSGGADYAIDDIRVYLVKPVVYADQTEPICEQTNYTDVKISAPFDVLLQSLGQAEAATSADGGIIDIYYSFIDKKEYDAQLASGATTDEAFNAAVLRYNYRGGEKVTHFGRIGFNTHFESNEQYHAAGATLSDHAFKDMDRGTRIIAFNTRPTDNAMISGKEYMIVLYLPNGDTGFNPEEGPTAALYQLGVSDNDKDCSKSCVFRVMASHTIKIDGEVVNPNDIIESCRNQSPIVQVDLYGKTDDGDTPQLIEENARFDWFAGSMEEFAEIKDEETGVDLWSALNHFRERYPLDDDLSDRVGGDYTAADSIIIDRYSRIDPTGQTKPRLILGRTSYVFPPLALPEGMKELAAYVLAVPIPLKKENLKICTQPTEVNVTVRQRAPRLRHGLADENIVYPPAIDDVPLRISLEQLRKVSAATASAAASHPDRLEVPIYSVVPVTEGVTDMRRPGGGSPLYIASTDDPQYKTLTFDPVGEVVTLDASRGGDNNRFCAVFYADKINFREGYEYSFRFNYEENSTAAVADEDVCTGHDVFTLKVVPRYQKWTGGVNLNWNNDRNWRRVASGEMLAAGASDFTNDGSNDRTFSYAPLDFTNTIIPENNAYPQLFGESTVDVKGFKWASNPSENAIAGDATPLVQYDMVQALRPGVAGVFCRPWYANTCREVHFEPGSQIAAQQYLHYDRAWVDMEVAPSLWFTLSSPLRSTVAGDMYLPTAGARQQNEYFTDINFVYGVDGPYNRFKPAVFQRSWNQAKALVYRYEGQPGNTVDVKVETTWSNVYNDVTVPYTAGHGFSVKADLTSMAGAKPDKVLFRLPKADTSYDYYTDKGASGDHTDINRTAPGRLNLDEKTPGDITAVIEALTADNKYFLVGNPFMSHLDMAAFLSVNSGVIEPKYWVLDATRQGAAVMSPDGTIDGSVGDDPNYLPPMTGFFVEAKTAAKNLSVIFSPDMASVVTAKGSSGGDSRSAAESVRGIRVTAVESGSTALLLRDALASAGYDSAEDAMLLCDNSLGLASMVYTKGGDHTLTVNRLPEVNGTEVGVIADENTVTTLRFDGLDGENGLMLYDAAHDSYTDLEDGVEVRVEGAAAGRLFIVDSRMSDGIRSLAVSLNGRRLTVRSLAGGLAVSVYNTMGVEVASYDDGADKADFNLERGIYIVESTDVEDSLISKIIVK